MLKKTFSANNSGARISAALWLVVLAALCLGLSCSRSNSDATKKPAENNPETGSATVNQPQPPAPAPAVQRMRDMPFEQLVKLSTQLLDQFWKSSFDEMGWSQKFPYRTPLGPNPYVEPVQSGCGVLPLNNAFYCTSDHTIYYDDGLVRSLYKEPGDYAAVTVLAHEWGHSVQGLTKVLGGDKAYYSIQTELQADCYSGAFARYLFQQGYLEEGDLDEGGEALLSLGDRRGSKWFDPQAHGKPFERGAYFHKGWEGGIRACVAKE